MIEITISTKKGLTKKLLNPTNLFLSKEEFGLTVQSDSTSEVDCHEAIETQILAAEGDQRVWRIANLGNDITPELYLSQYRVIGYKVKRCLFSDCTDVLPISTGLQGVNLDECDNSALFLVDMDLKQINFINAKNYSAYIDEETQNTDIMGSISQALKIPLLCESDLPIELQDYLKQNIEPKKVSNLK